MEVWVDQVRKIHTANTKSSVQMFLSFGTARRPRLCQTVPID
ncbi:hypothetical protein J2W32_003750 [Variovorax boronicumulans]|uniref:Uncharacterized protein n=1 Tax=Variovorax boronicumulans TaxID=436515 RepID=A0AAW8CU68_9BURK|nr:hypothetical protein [Variovorax boronicumulans]MDQ0038482.1 hypothetical protein [Variovorax boronicumulans]MDQ0044645.1 hypothetical protein [Variovorax boronicumulans]MDQ0054692.1 hypothetical protein [Variovorax boronicumulans]